MVHKSMLCVRTCFILHAPYYANLVGALLGPGGKLASQIKQKGESDSESESESDE